MLGFFPDFYKDELFLSVIARSLERRRSPHIRASIRELFGACTYKPILDFPSHLDTFRSRLYDSCDYPCVDRIIDEHTLFPLYAPFLHLEQRKRLRMDMHKDAGHAARMHAGIISSKIPLMKELRICPKCVQADRETVGEAYWHRSHQVQGVKVCYSHEIPLEKIKNDFVGEEYISAEKALEESEWEEIKSNQNDKEKLLNLAVDANWLLTHPQDQITPQILYKQYRDLLAQRGFVQKYGSYVFANKLTQSFEEYYSNDFLQLLNCPLKNHVSSNWLIRLLRSKGTDSQHPIHHLLLFRFLGRTADSFFQNKDNPTDTAWKENSSTPSNSTMTPKSNYSPIHSSLNSKYYGSTRFLVNPTDKKTLNNQLFKKDAIDDFPMRIITSRRKSGK